MTDERRDPIHEARLTRAQSRPLSKRQRLKAAFWRWWHRNIVADREQSAIYDAIDRDLRSKGL